MKTPALMVLGTASHVGKSVIAAGLCRILRQEGYRVAPFKAQNMSLNAAVAAGGEIGRAQAVQAAACGLPPSVDMNPVLLKPSGANDCELVVQGRARGLRSSREYGRYGEEILDAIRASYARLAMDAEVMVLEGAGSPAEINLLDRDFANMWMAEEADARCLLVGDIERGGVFAALYGTWLLAPHRHRIRGFAINKFRGSTELLGSGPEQLRRLAGVPVLGVLPYRELLLPEEDSLGLPAGNGAPAAPSDLRIGVVRLPHIANFTDFEPLQREPGVDLRYVWDADALDACDVILLPGSKSTVDDLQSLRARGLEAVLGRAAARGTPILGICAGYQMLGATIADPHHVESTQARTEGLALLPVETVFALEKRVQAVRGVVYGTTIEVEGYWMHYGPALRKDGGALLALADELEGCVHDRIWGTSVHGLFENPGWREFALGQWREWTGKTAPTRGEEMPSLGARLDAWADCLREHLDLAALFSWLNLGRPHA